MPPLPPPTMPSPFFVSHVLYVLHLTVVGGHTRRVDETGHPMMALDGMLDNVEAAGPMLVSAAASTSTSPTNAATASAPAGLNLMAMLQPTVRRQDIPEPKKTRKVTDLSPGQKMQLIRQALQHLNLTAAIVAHPSANKSKVAAIINDVYT